MLLAAGRVPAGFNGCVGMKGTVGSVSTVGESHCDTSHLDIYDLSRLSCLASLRPNRLCPACIVRQVMHDSSRRGGILEWHVRHVVFAPFVLVWT